jgi:hypothetical protein
MALSSSELSALIKQKVDTYKGTAAALPDDDPNKTDVSYIFDAIAEAVVEHIVAKAAVRVPVVGLDLGGALATEWSTRFTERGDTQAPGALIPDTALQNETNSTAVLPTTAPAVSIMISTPGFID